MKKVVAACAGLLLAFGAQAADEGEDEEEVRIICPQDVQATCEYDFPDRYLDMMDFIVAGGIITNEDAVEEFTFRSQEKKDPEGTGNRCEYKVERTYSIALANKGPRISCVQTIYVKDTVPPDYEGADTVLISAAGGTIIDIPAEINVTDMCHYAEATYDPAEDSITRSDNEYSCAYYSYSVRRIYKAKDACGNVALYPVTYKVKDENVPTFMRMDMPEKVLADGVRGCTFLVPDIRSNVVDEIADMRDSAMVVSQYPERGEVMTESGMIMIETTDLCGKRHTDSVYCIVQNPKEICSVSGYDTTVCIRNERDVPIEYLFGLSGAYISTWHGEYVTRMPVMHREIYEGTADGTLLFSTEQKYGNRPYLTPNDGGMSKKYTMVAWDTTLGCRDTATAYVMVNEYPRMSLYACTLKKEEGDTLSIEENWKRRFQVCIDDNASEILDEGWMVNGEVRDGDIYGLTDTLRIEYYVTNVCGTATSTTCEKPMCGKIEPEDAYITVAVNKKQTEGGDSDAVINIPAEADVVSEEYYNLGGQRVKEPVQGVNLVKRTRVDGSAEWIKVVGH